MFGRQIALVVIAAAVITLAEGGSVHAQDAQQLQNLQKVIEQQQRQIEAQQKSLEDLRRQVQTMQQTSEQATKSAAQAQDAAARAQKSAETMAATPQVTAGQHAIKLQIYGQINQMINTANDGKSTKAYFLSNNLSAPRLGIVGKVQYNDDLAFGPQVEVAVKPNPSNKVSQTNESDTSADDTFEARKVEGFAKSKTYGDAYLGRGDPSTKDIARIDLSGTDVVAFADEHSDLEGLHRLRHRPDQPRSLRHPGLARPHPLRLLRRGPEGRRRPPLERRRPPRLQDRRRHRHPGPEPEWRLQRCHRLGLGLPHRDRAQPHRCRRRRVCQPKRPLLRLRQARMAARVLDDRPNQLQRRLAAHRAPARPERQGRFLRCCRRPVHRRLRHGTLCRLPVLHPRHRQPALGRRHLRRDNRCEDQILMGPWSDPRDREP
jgi:flagellar motor protein MotB